MSKTDVLINAKRLQITPSLPLGLKPSEIERTEEEKERERMQKSKGNESPRLRRGVREKQKDQEVPWRYILISVFSSENASGSLSAQKAQQIFISFLNPQLLFFYRTLSKLF